MSTKKSTHKKKIYLALLNQSASVIEQGENDMAIEMMNEFDARFAVGESAARIDVACRRGRRHTDHLDFAYADGYNMTYDALMTEGN